MNSSAPSEPARAPAWLLCGHCGATVPGAMLVCPHCGTFTHLNQLNQLAAEAIGMESVNPWAAMNLWQQCLALIPIDAPQAASLHDRIDALSAGRTPPRGPGAKTMTEEIGAEPVRREPHEDPLSIALLKTLGSMALSIVVYGVIAKDMAFAAAFVVLLLVHELGHVAANKYYGLSASPPLFIPFLGAVINLRQRPPDAKAEAVIGIAGPVAGTLGALVAYAYALHTGSERALAAAHFGFLLNLFNLLPVPPLDGGRVTAAVSPWIWPVGLLGLLWMFIADLRHGDYLSNFILGLVFFYSFPRIRATLQNRDQFGDYYRMSRVASWSIGVAYLLLGLSLIYLYQSTT